MKVRWPYIRWLRLDTYKLFLSLAVITLLGTLVWTGTALFSHQLPSVLTPLTGSFLFLAEVALFIWSAWLLRKNIRRSPSFKVVVLSLVSIVLVFAFAGVQPLASYKDSTVHWAGSQLDRIVESSKVEEPGAGESRPPQEDATTPAREEAETDVEGLEREVVALVNGERAKRKAPALAWDDTLYGIAREHSEEMARQGRLFHSSMYEPYAENCWGGGPGSFHYFRASDIMASWMGSDKHRTWLLCPHLKHVGVGIAVSDEGVYASWTFWREETTYSDWWYMDSSASPPDWWY